MDVFFGLHGPLLQQPVDTRKVTAAETVPVPLLADAYLNISTVETSFYLCSLPFTIAPSEKLSVFELNFKCTARYSWFSPE